MLEGLLPDIEVAVHEFMHGAHRLELDENAGIAYRGFVTVEGREVTLALCLDPAFPLHLPVIFLEPWDALGFIPHVSPNGVVCYLDKEGMLLDGTQPANLVRDAFVRALAVLSNGVAGVNLADFVDELDVYWSYLSQDAFANLLHAPSSHICELALALENGGPAWIATDRQEIAAFRGSNVEHLPELSYEEALYIPLKPGTTIIPPRPDRPFWTTHAVRKAILPNLSPSNRAILKNYVDRRPRAHETVIVSVPRSSEGHSVIGIRFGKIGRTHPLHPHGHADDISPLQLIRLDREYLLGRGGASSNPSEKRTLIVGCGALGGRIVLELAQSGIKEMTVVDDDVLLPENSFRHVLGRSSWGVNKATALKVKLEQELPYVRIAAFPEKIENLIANGTIDFSDFDLVVFALGNPTVELAMNASICGLDDAPIALYTWLEPFGIGGHGLLVQPGGRGCFECLYADSRGDDAGMFNKASFAAKGQKFGRALSGCGSQFTPYGVTDAATTSSLAVRLALDALMGKESGNALRSWRGDATQFLEERFVLSDRFGVSDRDLVDQRYTYATPNCSVCGDARGS